MIEDDYSAEDAPGTEQFLSSSSQSEFQSLLNRLKYQERRAKLLYLRSLGQKTRKELRAKYNATSKD